MSCTNNTNNDRVNIIPSKSDAHRAIICAALSKVCSEDKDSFFRLEKYFGIKIEETSVDIDATWDCMKSLLSPTDAWFIPLPCRESGSTLRFILPVIGALRAINAIDKPAIFFPEGRLSERPISPLKEELEHHGMSIRIKESFSPKDERIKVPSIEVEGSLKSGDYYLPGNVSSQYISGLLFALPLLDGDSRIIISGELESVGYVEMTIRTLSQFGIKINSVPCTIDTDNEREINQKGGISYCVLGNQRYIHNGEYVVEGDWSNAAFWLAAGLMGERAITVSGLNLDSAQGDKKILDIINSFGGIITINEQEIKEQKINEQKIKESEVGTGLKDVTAHPTKEKLKGITIDARDIPDLVPVIALIATQAFGETRIINAGRLRIKESDRLNSIATTLKTLGADIEELEDSLVIKGDNQRLRGGAVDSFGDHRIAMMAAVASLVCSENIVLTGSVAVKKSYPRFFEELGALKLDSKIDKDREYSSK